MQSFKRNLFLLPIVAGIVMIIIGIVLRVPGGALTTYSSLDGEETEHYVFDDTYSSIDEYVGGDAYNYIIGACLVAGKISGTLTVKAVYIVGGVLAVCIGLLMLTLSHNAEPIPSQPENDPPTELPPACLR